MEKTPERKKRPSLKDRTPTGAWRERFRKGCFERLKSNRQNLVNTFRNTEDSQSSQEYVSQLMADEWQKMKLESPLLKNLPRCSHNRDNFEFVEDDLDDLQIDEILNVFEDIQQELLREEQRILKEYEDLVTFDERYLCSAIDLLSTDSVTCPVCKRDNLMQNGRIIFCRCGIRLDTEVDAIDLKYVNTMLREAIMTHSCTCDKEPVFGVVDLTGSEIKNLIMTCQACDVMAIII